jgi:hypothetical protein
VKAYLLTNNQAVMLWQVVIRELRAFAHLVHISTCRVEDYRSSAIPHSGLVHFVLLAEVLHRDLLRDKCICSQQN